MPINPSYNHLGIANPSIPRGRDFAQYVLRLPVTSPLYQQQLAHNLQWQQGTLAAAEYYPPSDPEQWTEYTFRQVSVHNTPYALRNVLATTFNQVTHRRNANPITTNQIYYLNNEPEDSTVDSQTLDPFIQPYFPTTSSFWSAPSLPARATPQALATTYKILRDNMAGDPLSNTRGHILLPPASIRGRLGAYDSRYGTGLSFDGDRYWKDFYDSLLMTHQTYVEDLHALHVHQYDFEYTDGQFADGNYKKPANTPTYVRPIKSAAATASRVMTGARWFRTRYQSRFRSGGNLLPIDLLLSETGFDWRIERPIRPRGALYPYLWAGGWPSLKLGLSWWNTWLYWLTRRAATDCGLAAGRSLFACFHTPSSPPYATPIDSDNYSNTWSRGNYRHQSFFNCDSWTGSTYINAPCIRAPALQNETTGLAFLNSFTAIISRQWQGLNWYTGPFGACLKVWAEVGADPIWASFGGGWWLTNVNGLSAQGSVTLEPGYNTVYIPIIKRQLGQYGANDQFLIYFVHQNGTQTQVGQGKFAEIPDSEAFNENFDFLADCTPPYTTDCSVPTNIEMSSAMVYPVVCYSAATRVVGVKIYNSSNGRNVYYGRPIALGTACSWIATQ